MAKIKRIIDKLAPAPRSLADACGESKIPGDTAPDVARRRDQFIKKHESCCGAVERDEACSRRGPQQCDEAPTEEEA